MCYNVRVELSKAQIQEAFNLVNAAAWEGERSRITIGQDLPAIVETDHGRILDMMHWGFVPSWSKDPKGGMKPGNARAETVASTPMFRDAFKTRRCVVPVTGFFEWIGEKGSKQLLPFSLKDRPIFSMPGIYETWTTPEGDKRTTIATITADPNGDMRPYHDRMPVIFDKDEEAYWLSADAKKDNLLSLLMPISEGILIAHPDQAFKPSRGHHPE